MAEQKGNRHGIVHAAYTVGLPGKMLPENFDPKRLLLRGTPQTVNFVLESEQ